MGSTATLAAVLAIFTLTGHFVISPCSASPLQSQQSGQSGLEGLHELYEQLVAAANLGAGSPVSAAAAAAPPPESYYGPGLLELLAGRLAAAQAAQSSGPSSAGFSSYGLPSDAHQMVRKSNRTPSLRLRYGRSDPAMKMNPAAYQNSR